MGRRCDGKGGVTQKALRSLSRSAEAPLVTQSTEDQLHAALWAFHTAVQRRDGVESRLRRGEIDADLYDRSLHASEAVMASRLGLYRLLIEQGWIPPSQVLQDIAYDDSVLHEASGGLG
jgi:hypothetical protein